MKRCSKCKIEKDSSDFNKKTRNKDGLQAQCKECLKEIHKKHYEEKTQYYKNKAAKNNLLYRIRNLEYMVNYLVRHSCVDCGENDPTILEFDHRSDKSYDVSTMTTFALSKLDSEIAKCDVRCANCHRRKTANQFGYYKHIRIPIMALIDSIRFLKEEVKRFEEEAKRPRYYFTNYYQYIHKELIEELNQSQLTLHIDCQNFSKYESNTITFTVTETNHWKKNPSSHKIEFRLLDSSLIGPEGSEVSFKHNDIAAAQKQIGNELKEAIINAFCKRLNEEVQKVKGNPFAQIEFGYLLGKPGLHD
jgi:hypothetical protein